MEKESLEFMPQVLAWCQLVGRCPYQISEGRFITLVRTGATRRGWGVTKGSGCRQAECFFNGVLERHQKPRTRLTLIGVHSRWEALCSSDHMKQWWSHWLRLGNCWLAVSKDEALGPLGFGIYVFLWRRAGQVESRAPSARHCLIHSFNSRAYPHHLKNTFGEAHTYFLHLLGT